MELNIPDLRAVSTKTSRCIRVHDETLKKFRMLLMKCGAPVVKDPYATLCKMLRNGTEEPEGESKKYFADREGCGYVSHGYLLFQIVLAGRAYHVLDVVDVRSALPLPRTTASGIDLATVQFTRHALEQFEKRYREQTGIRLACPREKALELLAQAREGGALSGLGRVRRLIDNKFREAKYYLNPPWRFVFSEKDGGKLVAVTIEVAYRA